MSVDGNKDHFGGQLKNDNRKEKEKFVNNEGVEGVYEGDGKRTEKATDESKTVLFLDDNMELKYILDQFFEKLAEILPGGNSLRLAFFCMKISENMDLVHLLTERNILLEETVLLLQHKRSSIVVALMTFTDLLGSIPVYYDAWIVLMSLLCKSKDEFPEDEGIEDVFFTGIFFFTKATYIQTGSVELFSNILETFNLSSCEKTSREMFSRFVVSSLIRPPPTQSLSWKWKMVKILSVNILPSMISVDNWFTILIELYNESLFDIYQLEMGMQNLLRCFSMCLASRCLGTQYVEKYRNYVLVVFELFKTNKMSLRKTFFSSNFFQTYMDMVNVTPHFRITEVEMNMCLELNRDMTFFDERLVTLVRSFKIGPLVQSLASELLDIVSIVFEDVDRDIDFLDLKDWFVKLNLFFTFWNSNPTFLFDGIYEKVFEFFLNCLRKMSFLEKVTIRDEVYNFQLCQSIREHAIRVVLQISDETKFCSNYKLSRVLESVCRYLCIFSKEIERYCRHELMVNHDTQNENLFEETQLYCVHILSEVHNLCTQKLSKEFSGIVFDEFNLRQTWRLLRAFRKEYFCNSCMKVAFLRCPCDSDTRYCSKKCQHDHLAIHRQVCKERRRGVELLSSDV